MTWCEGDSVVRVFYGDNIHFAAGWWGACAECGAIVKVLADGGGEWPMVHPPGGWRDPSAVVMDKPKKRKSPDGQGTSGAA